MQKVSLPARFAAFVTLTAFLFVNCSLPDEPENINHGVVITPGEGTPRYLYLDAQGNPSDEDSCGLTGFYVEDNKNAEGVVVVAENGSDRNTVAVYNPHNESTVVFYYKNQADFPYLIAVLQKSVTDKVWFSNYRADEQRYDITIQDDGASFDSICDIYMSRDLLSLYEDDVGLTTSQNLRMKLITNSLAVWGNLAATFEAREIYGRGPLLSTRTAMARSWLNSLFNGIKKVFAAIAVVALVVSVIAVAVATLFVPVLVPIIVNTALVVAGGAAFVSGAFATPLAAPPIAYPQGPTGSPMPPKIINVTMNGLHLENGKEFHIGLNSDITLKFTTPRYDISSFRLFHLIDGILPYENGIGSTLNYPLFEQTLETTESVDQLQLKIKRSRAGYNDTGKISLGYRIFLENLVVINDSTDGVLYKLPGDTTEKIYKNLFVVRFCILPSCPDYVP